MLDPRFPYFECGLRSWSATRSAAAVTVLPADGNRLRTAQMLALIVLAAILLQLAGPARAALGGDAATVEADRQQISASIRHEPLAAFTVHHLATATGASVREYATPAGRVFGVAWNGPSMPNLRQLLGAHFATFTGSPNRHSNGHSRLVVKDGALIVESSGRMRAFHGRAYLSNALPTGVSIDEIQ